MFDILEADIVIMQEAKIQKKDLQDDMVLVPGWDAYFSLPKHKKGIANVLAVCIVFMLTSRQDTPGSLSIRVQVSALRSERKKVSLAFFAPLAARKAFLIFQKTRELADIQPYHSMEIVR
jgi:exonuclease III